MRVIVVGLGIQGRKRRAIAGVEAVATVDPVNPEADYRSIGEISKDRYDAALVCTPDDAKVELLTELLGSGKHVLVEKPLLGADNTELERLAALAKAKRVVCYVAYNHRFEPHFVRMKETIESGVLGRIYSCRMFYGNGTARDVRNSAWRDQGAGVLPDLGSHLLDTLMFWFGVLDREFRVWSADRFENRAFDHVVFGSCGTPLLELEISLLSWRNHFTCDIFAEHGSAHIESLCKWGPSIFTHRTRVLPSGRPPEESVTLVQPDPTWAIEYEHFKKLSASAETHVSLDVDLRLNTILNQLADEAMALSPGP